MLHEEESVQEGLLSSNWNLQNPCSTDVRVYVGKYSSVAIIL